MSFVRIKTIKGHQYAYQVENHWNGTSSRQKVTAYLGKVLSFPTTQSAPAPDMSGAFGACVDELIAWQLVRMGFKRQDRKLSKGKLAFDLDRQSFMKSERPTACVIKNHEGYICMKTIQTLRQFHASGLDHETGKELALAVVNAGLELPKELFVALFEKATATKRKSRKLEEELLSRPSKAI